MQTQRLKRIKRITLLWLGPVVIVAVSAWIYLHGGRYVKTDNAYLKAEMVSISSEVAGKITDVMIQDKTYVEAGQILFRVDQRPYRIALQQAEAQLASVRSDIASLQAEYRNKVVSYNGAKEDLAYYEKDLERLQRLHETSSVSTSQVDDARHLRDHQKQITQAAWEEVQLVKARLIDPELPIDENPQVKLAQASVDQAQLDLEHTETRAPFSGIVANFDLNPGEFLNAGLPLFSLVDTGHFWIEANFKETDLTHLQQGQDVNIRVDSFPGQELTGQVSGFTPGTGAEFSLLPAQNSSGNWVKVVQRVSVDIDLDEQELPAGLAAGMSVEVNVDTHYQRQLPWVGKN